MAIRAAIGCEPMAYCAAIGRREPAVGYFRGRGGLLLAWWGIKLLLAIAPDNLPRAHDIRLDTRVAGFTLFVSLPTGIVFGLLPALQASKINLGATLKEAGATPPDDRASFARPPDRGRSGAGFWLPDGAGLLIRSFARTEVDPGLDPRGVLQWKADIMLPFAKYKDGRSVAFFQQTLERAPVLPGAPAAATPLLAAEWRAWQVRLCH